MEVSGRLHGPAALPSGKSPPPGTHWRGGWVGPRASVDMVSERKFPCPRRESNYIKYSECQCLKRLGDVVKRCLFVSQLNITDSKDLNVLPLQYY
jgi:hypothetical protein